MSGIYLNFIVAIVTKMAAKIGLKSRNGHFGPHFRFWEAIFFSKAKYQTVACCGNSYHLLKSLLGIYLCSMLIYMLKVSNLRMQCSSLNTDLYHKNIIPSPSCLCGD